MVKVIKIVNFIVLLIILLYKEVIMMVTVETDLW